MPAKPPINIPKHGEPTKPGVSNVYIFLIGGFGIFIRKMETQTRAAVTADKVNCTTIGFYFDKNNLQNLPQYIF